MEPQDLEVITTALRDDVLCQDNKYDLLIAARDFSCTVPGWGTGKRDKFQFDMCDLPDGKEYAYHFI